MLVLLGYDVMIVFAVGWLVNDAVAVATAVHRAIICYVFGIEPALSAVYWFGVLNHGGWENKAIPAAGSSSSTAVAPWVEKLGATTNGTSGTASPVGRALSSADNRQSRDQT